VTVTFGPGNARGTDDAVEHLDEMPSGGLWSGAWRRVRRSPMAIVGAVIVALFILVAIFAPLLAPYDPASAEWVGDVSPYFIPGHSPGHLLGLDRYGSDELTQLIFGARLSLVIGVLSTLIGVSVGTVLGTIAGGLGGVADTVVMRFVDIMLSIPSLMIAISVAAIAGRSSYGLAIAIGTAQIPIFARLLRGSMLSQARADYVTAAESLGIKRRNIVLGHVLPNSIGPTIVQATLNLATAIIEVAALSYLGLGDANPRVAEWGRMIVSAQDRFEIAPWLAVYPGVAIAITALGFTLLGEALREALDPKQRR
jgi:peptide/nickel transport system permease protein